MRITFRRPRKDSTLLKAGLVLATLLYILGSVLSDNEVYTLGMHVVRFFGSLGVLVIFSGHWLPALSAERIGKVDIMALSIAGYSLSHMYHAGYSTFWRLLGRPDSMMSSDWNGIGYYICILSIFGLFASQRNETNAIPRANVLYTLIVLSIGICVGVLAAMYHETFAALLTIDINSY